MPTVARGVRQSSFHSQLLDQLRHPTPQCLQFALGSRLFQPHQSASRMKHRWLSHLRFAMIPVRALLLASHALLMRSVCGAATRLHVSPRLIVGTCLAFHSLLASSRFCPAASECPSVSGGLAVVATPQECDNARSLLMGIMSQVWSRPDDITALPSFPTSVRPLPRAFSSGDSAYSEIMRALFIPPESGTYVLTVTTSGSVTLVMQDSGDVLPVASAAPQVLFFNFKATTTISVNTSAVNLSANRYYAWTLSSTSTVTTSLAFTRIGNPM